MPKFTIETVFGAAESSASRSISATFEAESYGYNDSSYHFSKVTGCESSAFNMKDFPSSMELLMLPIDKTVMIKH